MLFSHLMAPSKTDKAMKEITVQELKEMQDSGKDFQLVDVREPNEHSFSNIGGELVPLGTIMAKHETIAKDKQVVVYCRSGKRSASAIQQLEDSFKFDNLYNLKGGYLAYAEEIDDSLPLY